MNPFRSRLAAVIAALVLAACAASSDPAPTWERKLQTEGWKVGAEVGSVANFSFDGFEVLDATHLVIHSSVTRRVLVTAGPGCSELATARRIGYEGSGLSLGRLDRLLVMAPPGMPAHCLVQSLHLLEKAGA